MRLPPRLLKPCNLFAHFHHEIRADTKIIIDSGTRHRSTPEVNVTLRMTRKRALTREQDEHSVSSGDTAMQEEITDGAVNILNQNEDYQTLSKKLSSMESDAIEQSKKKVKYGERPRNSNGF